MCALYAYIYIPEENEKKKKEKEAKQRRQPKELTRNQKCDVAEIFFDLETIK